MKKRKKIKRKYCVNIHMKWSEDVAVTATSAGEARKIAWNRFRKNPPRSLFGFFVDREDDFTY